MMNLLIVNDEELTADTMKEDICWKDYGIDEVFVAYNAVSARTCINSGNIDILLCDIEMPRESGLALLKWVRENNKLIECIFLTCHASFEYARQAISLGCREYLLMPARYEDIGAAVKKVADRLEAARSESILHEYGEAALQNSADVSDWKSIQKKDPGELTREIKQYIKKSLGEESLSVASVAEQFHFHPVYINRVFRSQTGKSISQFIIDERMRLAEKLLKSGNYSVNSVALMVGYHNYLSFFSAFKKHFGCTPSAIGQKNEKTRILQ